MVVGMDDAFSDIDGPGGGSSSAVMPPTASGVWHEPQGAPVCQEGHRPQASPIGAGYLVLVARELTGLSQRKLAERAGTTQPSVAKIESGSRIPTVRTLLRIAGSAGYELVLGLIGADEDPLLPDELDAFALLGVLRSNPTDGLADFVVLREPSVFDSPTGDGV